MENNISTDPAHHEFEAHEFLHHDVLPSLNRDMRFVGVFYIIYGAFACLSIVGAVIGIPVIIMGLRLRDTARGLEVYNLHDSQKALHFAFVKQRSFFSIQKIIVVVLILLMVANIFVLFYFMGIGSLGEMFETGEVQTMLQKSFSAAV